MNYREVIPAVFLVRESRFLARVRIGEREEKVHVKNTGRLAEWLIPGAEVYLEPAPGSGGRQTAYSLVAARTPSGVVNLDSQAPNELVHEELTRPDGWLLEWLLGGAKEAPNRPAASPGQAGAEDSLAQPESAGRGLVPAKPSIFRREVRYGSSRFDFCVEAPDGGRLFLEVKGVTLVRDGCAEFPDAPTGRGARHLDELAAAVREGYAACALFVVQLEGVRSFAPCRRIDPAFADALARAAASGVTLAACGCRVAPGSIRLGEPISVTLGPPSP